MTISTEQVPEQKPADKELNFRQLEQRAMQAERRAQEAERKAQEAERLAKELASKQTQVQDDDDDSSEPYVDQKRLRKQLDKFGQQTMQATQGEIQKAETEHFQVWKQAEPFQRTGLMAVGMRIFFERIQKEVKHQREEFSGQLEFLRNQEEELNESPEQFIHRSVQE